MSCEAPTLCERVSRLPEVLEGVIADYLLDSSVLWRLNRRLLADHYKHVLHGIRRGSTYDSHIRDVLRNRRYTIFKAIVDLECERWCRWRRYSYKNEVYSAYPQYLASVCLQYGSQRCREYLVQRAMKTLYDKKKHKKENRKGTRWNT